MQKLGARHPRKRWINLLLLIPSIAVMAGLSLGAIWLIGQWQSLRCPSETFLAGSGQAATIFQIVPIMFASIGFGFLGVNWFAHSIPPLRKFFDRDARRHGETGYRRSQRQLMKFSLAVLAIALPIVPTAALSQYCLLAQGIRYQPWPWTGLRPYSWGDVATIETTCTRGRSSWSASFFLIMRDGAKFDIMTWPRSMLPVYPEIASALKGVDFVFDAQGVRRGCDLSYRDLLLARP
jgi:hypothetical protein